MKTILQKTLLAITCLLCSIGTSAHDFEVDGIYYRILSEANKTVKVTYRGDKYNSYDDEYTGSVVVPESVAYNETTYSVTSIGNYSFRDCTGLTSITIPNSVTTIGYYAFRNCTSLMSVTIGNSVTSIGSFAFYDCSALTSITIPNSVTSIGDGAFSGCIGLTTVTIPNSVTETGYTIFFGCNITNICISDIATICNDVWSDLSRADSVNLYLNDELVTEAVIPEGVTSICDNAFKNCTALTMVTIPNTVTSIGDYAFSSCSALTSITIPNSVTSIGDYAFYDCIGLTTITIPNSITKMGHFIFNNCKFSNIYISDITTICNDVWSNLSRADSVNLYLNDELVTEAVIPEGVTSICDNAFKNCTALTMVTIPNSVTSIGSFAFYGCIRLKDVNCKATVPPTINKYTFDAKKEITLHVPVKSINAYKNAEHWKMLNISEKYIVGNLYYNILSDTDVEVTYKDENYNSYSGDIEIPEIVKIDDNSYNVIKIGENAFRGCADLTKITIPNSVTSIGDFAFYGCTNLTEIYSKAIIPPTIQSNTFGACNNMTIYVPAKSINVYKNAEHWKMLNISEKYIVGNLYYNVLSDTDVEVTYKDENYNSYSGDIEIPEIVKIDDNSYNVIKIGENAFKNCTDLTEINIPKSVILIEKFAFSGCENLTQINIPISVTEIGYSAFEGCTSLTQITIPNSVTLLGNSVFNGCTGLAEVTIGCGVPSLGDRVFYKCHNLTSITIPNNITSIGNFAFYGCYGLMEITIPNSVVSIGNDTFSGCKGLTSVTIGNSVISIGERAFNNCADINRIIVKPVVAPSIWSSTFSEVNKMNSILEVPRGYLSEYKDALYWSDFINIEETGSGSINTTVSDNINIGIIGDTLSINGVADDAVVNIYTTSGMLLHHTTVAGSSNIALPSGIYLIQVDGITKKVAV